MAVVVETSAETVVASFEGQVRNCSKQPLRWTDLFRDFKPPRTDSVPARLGETDTRQLFVLIVRKLV